MSGQKKIKMADLKSVYESLGFKNVLTYIQSGNVIFDSDISKARLSAMIENVIKKKYRFSVPVILRTSREFSIIVRNNPFGSVNVAEDGAKILVTFLASTPKKSDVTDLLSYVTPPEKLIIKGKEIYLHCPNGYGKSKLSNTFIEKKLEVMATSRNWKSVVMLHELSMA